MKSYNRGQALPEIKLTPMSVTPLPEVHEFEDPDEGLTHWDAAVAWRDSQSGDLGDPLDSVFTQDELQDRLWNKQKPQPQGLDALIQRRDGLD